MGSSPRIVDDRKSHLGLNVLHEGSNPTVECVIMLGLA